MGTYYIPRNVKGETRLFKVFSVKALIYTIVCAIPGIMLNFILSMLGIKYVGLVFIAIFAFIGFFIGTFRMPNISIAPIFKICAGEKIDEIIFRAIKLRKSKKIYVYGRDIKK